MQETKGLDEKCGQEGGEECSLDRQSSQMCMILLGLFGWAYEDEDDIEEILPFAFALVVFNASDIEVVFPGGFGLVYWIWKQSDWSALDDADLLSGGSAIGKGELQVEEGIILYSQNIFFCALSLACGVGKSGIAVWEPGAKVCWALPE